MSHAQVRRFFDGLELVEPGVVPVNHWRPAQGTAEHALPGWAAIGQKR